MGFTVMGEANQPTISIVLATHNRRDVVLNTLAHLARDARVGSCGLGTVQEKEQPCTAGRSVSRSDGSFTDNGARRLERSEVEIIVVDNASTDGTAEVVAPLVDQLIPLKRNLGSCAKAYGVDRARGRYVVFLDDDSYPWSGSLDRMMEHFEDDRQLGAAGFRVHLPDGREECGGLPDVFVGCGVGFRAEALRAAGGLDRNFFMQAEEYDLSFRLAVAGWDVRVFDDLHVEHLKSPHARRSERTAYYDVRNNLRVIERYVPAPWHRVYAEDCVQRYAWLASREGHEVAHERGRRAGRRCAWIDRVRSRSRRMSDAVFERFFRLAELRLRCEGLARKGVRRVVLADWGKNIFAYYKACHEAGLAIAAIADDRIGAVEGRSYRGVPIVPLAEAMSLDCDAVIVSNMAYVFARETSARVRRLTSRPVYSWFERADAGETAGFHSPTPRDTSDDKFSNVPIGAR
jgi:GT2 family glycosyltransferase